MTYSPSRGRPVFGEGEFGQQRGQIFAGKRPLEWARGGFHIWPKPGGEKKVDEVEFSLPEKIQIKVVVIKVNK